MNFFAKRLLLGLIAAYQKGISPWLGARCRFYPSCSEAAREAIVETGILRGVCFAAARLLSCHPFHPGGYNPPPRSSRG